jgi:tetratricopeptide (TPR) repeat protein
LRNDNRALEDYSTAIELSPSWTWALAGRALILELNGRFQEALADIDKAMEQEPSIANHHQIRGDIRLRMNQPREALGDFNEAIRLDPDSGPAYLGRSRAHYALNDLAACKEDRKRAQELGMMLGLFDW